MQHILPTRWSHPLPLYGAAATRQIERTAMARLPPHHLMQNAAEAVFRLGWALYPHARRIWLACGPGNNGGDGLLAAALWQQHLSHCGVDVCVTWAGNEQRLPEDARLALAQARAAGVRFEANPPTEFDLAVDALLGIGVNTTTTGELANWTARLQTSNAPVLCVDLPSGLNPDTGRWFNPCPVTPRGPRHTLSLLTLKPGLFTASGREAAGDIWLDDLGCHDQECATIAPPDAWLNTLPAQPFPPRHLRHAAHKGSHGDLQILGGQDVRVNSHGMTGAALLAARAGLHGGAGRVFVGLLGPIDTPALTVDPHCPELMFRAPDDLLQTDALAHTTTVCGCGGGEAVRTHLPAVLAHSTRLVLDADALNAIATTPAWQEALAQRATRQQMTVLTPHPLEAARLLGSSTDAVQADRLAAARQLAQRFQCVVILKGSGSVIAAPGRTPHINPTGNALLATAGTGDVLAGLLGAYWSKQTTPDSTTADDSSGWNTAWEASCAAVYQHGQRADDWPRDQAFTASALISALGPR